jgi:hypothetical protein
VRADRDSAGVWRVAFVLDASGFVTAGRRLTIEHGGEAPDRVTELSAVRSLGDGWYLHDYVW